MWNNEDLAAEIDALFGPDREVGLRDSEGLADWPIALAKMPKGAFKTFERVGPKPPNPPKKTDKRSEADRRGKRSKDALARKREKARLRAAQAREELGLEGRRLRRKLQQLREDQQIERARANESLLGGRVGGSSNGAKVGR